MQAIVEGMNFPLTIPQGFRITPEQFEQLADVEQSARLELTASGELIVMSPTGGDAGAKNFNLYIDLGIWNRQTKLGVAFDSSTIFAFPNGSRKSPDVSWVKLERWESLTFKEKQGFPPIAPDFVIELVSPSDLKSQRYQDLQDKMQEYLDNGVKLGWLIEPSAKTVEIYRSGQQVEVLDNPQTLSGEDILPKFTLDLTEVFAS
jgi:Uma2 family endonuclease